MEASFVPPISSKTIWPLQLSVRHSPLPFSSLQLTRVGRCVSNRQKTLHLNEVPAHMNKSNWKSSMHTLREVEMLQTLDHPNVLRVLDFVKSGDGKSSHLITELCLGPNLQKVLRKRGALEIAEAQTIFRQCVSALCHIHENGMIHRDIKPANILILEELATLIRLLGLPFVGSADWQTDKDHLAFGRHRNFCHSQMGSCALQILTQIIQRPDQSGHDSMIRSSNRACGVVTRIRAQLSRRTPTRRSHSPC